MNNICKVVWSHVHQQFVVVSEIASSLGKAKSTRAVSASVARGASGIQASIRTLCMAVACAVLAPAAWAQTAALPAGGQVVAGQGSIQTQGSVMTVNQASQRMALDWQSFNVGAGQTVNFVQPNAQATVLNRVLGSDVSTIQGQIHANGRVYLLNPNGILFTPSAQVNVGGLVASTLGMSNADFMAGNDRLSGDSTSAVTNQGQIRTAQGGTVALVAARVTNVGEISAPSGSALLAAGRKVRLDLGGPAQIEVEEGTLNALIEQSGSIRAADGMVYLTAKAASQLSGSAINQSGLIEAGSIDAKGGLVVLEADHIRLGSGSRIDATGAKGGGTVLVGGDWQGSGSLRQATTVMMESGSVIDASATDNGNGGKVVLWSDVRNANSVTTASGAIYAKGGSQGGDGGRIETSGAKLNTAAIQVDASAQVSQGKAGLWLIDPYDYVIDSTAATNIVNALNAGASGTSVEVTTQANAANYGSTASGTGNITVSNAINATGEANLSLTADGTVTLNAPISVGGNVSITTTGLSGSGGVALVSGKTLKVDQSGASTYNGVLSGSGAKLVKDGLGALTLSADHTYTGSTTISAGTLQVGNGGNTGSLATSGVTNNGTLRYYAGTDSTVPYVISGAGNLEIKGGESTLYSQFLTTTPVTIANNTTVLDVLERIAGGTQNGLGINCSGGSCTAIPAGSYNKNYDASSNSGTFQIQSYFYATDTNNFTKVVFVKLTQSGNDVQASAYQGRGSYYTVYATGNRLGDDFTTVPITGALNSGIPATSPTDQGYGVDKLFSSSKITFTANNTYTGNTSILNTVRSSTDQLQNGYYSTYERKTLGILSLGSGGTTGNIENTHDITNQGLLIFNRSDDLSFDRDISGAGNVIKDNTNTVSYLGSGTYTGMTYVNDGTLSVGDGHTAGSLTGNINNKGDVTFNRSDDVSYGGAISGTGTLTKSGGGALSLTTNHAYTGASAINDGQLILANNAPTSASSGFSGPGTLVIQPSGNDFSSALTTSAWNLSSNLGGLTIGKSPSSADGTEDKNVTVNSAINIAGPVSIYGGNVAVNAALTASRVTLKGSSTVSQTGAITATELLLLGGNVTLNHAGNNVATLAASGTGALSYWNSGALSIGTVGATSGISASGAVDVQTLSGDLTVSQNLSTSNATSGALLLNAGKSEAAGTTSGGNLIISGSLGVSVGTGGTAKLYSGSVSGSTGLTALVGSGSGRFRYNSDETTSNYTTALSAGLHAIYREQPSVTLSGTGSYSMIYGEALPTLSATGMVNGDVATLGAVNRVNSASGNIRAGSYSISSNLAGLGYAVSGLSGGTLTVSPRAIEVTASDATKVYGNADPALAYTAAATSGNTGLVVGDSLTGGLSRTAGENVGGYAINLGTLSNPDYNIGLATNNAKLQITPRPISVNVASKSKTYGDSDPVLTYSLTSGNLIGNDVLTLSRVTGENVGTYAITPANGNYSITANSADLNIAPRLITVLIDGKNKRSGDSDPAWTYQLLNGSLLSGDELTLSRLAGEAPGKYLISAANPNYQISADDAYLTVANRIESPTLVNGLLTVAPVQPAAQATSSAALSAPQAIVNPVAPLASANASAQVSSGLMMIPVGADQAKVLEAAAMPSADKSEGSVKPATAGWLQSAQALGYTGVLVVEGGVRLPDSVR